MAPSNKDKTPSSGASKSSGGGYYTPEFKSAKRDSNPDKSSTKAVSNISIPKSIPRIINLLSCFCQFWYITRNS